MTHLDYFLEQHWLNASARPAPKGSETITTFNRDIYWYNKDMITRQHATTERVTYQDHRQAIESAILVLGKTTQHAIALTVMSHRFFNDYRNKAFQGTWDFYKAYSFLVRKAGAISETPLTRVSAGSIKAKLKEYSTPTLVQVNHITGALSVVSLPESRFTLNEWAIKFNASANESTTYVVAGLSLS